MHQSWGPSLVPCALQWGREAAAACATVPTDMGPAAQEIAGTAPWGASLRTMQFHNRGIPFQKKNPRCGPARDCGAASRGWVLGFPCAQPRFQRLVVLPTCGLSRPQGFEISVPASHPPCAVWMWLATAAKSEPVNKWIL